MEFTTDIDAVVANYKPGGFLIIRAPDTIPEPELHDIYTKIADAFEEADVWVPWILLPAGFEVEEIAPVAVEQLVENLREAARLAREAADRVK